MYKKMKKPTAMIRKVKNGKVTRTKIFKFKHFALNSIVKIDDKHAVILSSIDQNGSYSVKYIEFISDKKQKVRVGKISKIN